VDQVNEEVLWVIRLWLRVTIVMTAIALLLSLAGIYAVRRASSAPSFGDRCYRWDSASSRVRRSLPLAAPSNRQAWAVRWALTPGRRDNACIRRPDARSLPPGVRRPEAPRARRRTDNRAADGVRARMAVSRLSYLLVATCPVTCKPRVSRIFPPRTDMLSRFSRTVGSALQVAPNDVAGHPIARLR
jgi:hypothetical protein